MNSVPETKKRDHSLTLRDRALLTLEGVADVRGFDESAVLLITHGGDMTVEGEGLHITHLALEEGRVTVEGKISGIFYTDEQRKAKGFFSRMVK